MKAFKLNKVRTFLLTCIVSLAAVFGATLSYALAKPVNANAETLSSTEYQTDGASIRVFQKNSDGSFTTTQRKGIRFHVEMGKNYAYNGKAILDLENTNENGSYVVNEGFKTYTLILPSRLLPESGDLTVDTEKVMKLDTSGYWYPDDEGNLESVAYVYDVPLVWYTDEFTFRGIICTVDESGNETVVASTEITDTSKRILAQVAKLAYSDTKAAIDDTTKTYWGSEDNDNKALDEIDKFIPKYEITYKVGETTTTETVVWGEQPQSVPDDIAFDEETLKALDYETKWYNEATNETVNLTEGLDLEISKLTTPITLTQASALKFRLTGVADYNNFTVDSTLYSGVKLYATLPVGDIYTEDEIKNGSERMVALTTDTVKVELQKSGEETTSAFTIQGVWTLMEGKSDGAQMRLVFAFDSGTLEDGDKLIVKADSVFYVSGVMYKLTEDYAIDYTVVSGTEDYGMFLGYLHNSDIKMIENYTETVNGNLREVIRITFYDDLLINSTFKFVYDGTLPAGYDYPVYTLCNDTGVKQEITQGYYYWNEGKHTILELDGYAYHNNDELFGVPGIKIVQNGGYYIFEDAMYAYYTGKEWVVGAEKGRFGVNAFESIGENYTAGTQEIRFTTNDNTTLIAGGTTNRWFDAVRQMYVENMSDQPYGVYHTSADKKTVTELEVFRYHGQADANNALGYNHIFAICDLIGTQAGEQITIVKDTRFWYGKDYFTATENINFYYNGANWIVGHDGTADEPITMDDFAGQNYEFYEKSTNKLRMHLNIEVFDGATGSLTIEKGSVTIGDTVYTDLYYHGDGNKIFEIIGNVTGDVTKTLGEAAFETTLTIEKGTRLWMGTYCIEFNEELQWIYVGGNHNAHGLAGDPTNDWVPNANTNITNADITTMYNATDAGGEVRLGLKAGILTNAYYGFGIIDTDKGIPVVNGNGYGEHAFFYGNQHNLIAVRGAEGEKSYGAKTGDYIVIPKGSVWWTAQGTITFTEEIRGVFDGANWVYGFNTETDLGSIPADDIQQVYKDGNNEIRIQIPLGYADTYYGPIAVDGQNQDASYDITVTKADGTVVSAMFAYWYGGASGTYNASHSLLGIQATGIAADLTDGDLLTIKADTKFIFCTARGTEGYYTFDKDVGYVYENGMWRSAEGWDVTFNFDHATVSVNGSDVQSGEAISLYSGAYNVTITPNSGYSITNVSNATNNLDGTYTVNVNANMNVTVTTKQSIKLAADAVSEIQVYAESGHTGVRLNLSETAYPSLNNITGVSNYGATMNGTTSVTSGLSPAEFAAGSTYNYFGEEAGSLLELRFDTANLVAGDTFTIAKGTVFNHANMAYAIEFTEDIVGYWTGTAWILNPVKAGDLDWNKVGSVISYSDYKDGSPSSYTIRIFLTEELFGGATGQGVATGNVTIDGTPYTGIWRYHGSGNKIVEISEWSYAQGQVLIIEKGTRIFIGSTYYETTNTLTATCQANGSGAQWTWSVS